MLRYTCTYTYEERERERERSNKHMYNNLAYHDILDVAIVCCVIL